MVYKSFIPTKNNYVLVKAMLLNMPYLKNLVYHFVKNLR